MPVSLLVVTVDISERMQEMARANAEIYGVIDKIRFVCSDAFDFLKSAERFDAILASPPWGGPDYSASTFSLGKLKISDERNIFDLVEAIARKIRSGGPVALFLPRNINTGRDFVPLFVSNLYLFLAIDSSSVCLFVIYSPTILSPSEIRGC